MTRRVAGKGERDDDDVALVVVVVVAAAAAAVFDALPSLYGLLLSSTP